MSGRAGERAVVLGGSMAGLCAARVLAEHHHDVQVLDRDDLEVGGRRRGVPQAAHNHALLPRGRQLLEELFPGLTAELIADGVPHGDLLGDARIHLSGHELRRGPSGLLTLSMSRTCLEDRVRARVRALPNVAFASPCDVVGLITSTDRRRVTGVRILRRADGSAEEVVPADLVVDAMGRGTRVPVWLEELGYEPPHEERIAVDVRYATRRYRLGADTLGGDWGTLQGPTPHRPRGGAMARIEGDRWIVTLFGMLGEHPPTDPGGFVRFAGSLPVPDIHTAIQHGEPLDDPVPFRFPASVRRRYERLRALPDGLVPLGDSVCCLNPVYGQGMTVAAAGAVRLRAHLREATPSPRRFVTALARDVDAAWDMVLGGDLALPGADGPRTLRTRLAGAYVTRLHAAAERDVSLATAFARVMSLIDPPEALMRPRVALRVLGPRVGGRRDAARDRPTASSPVAAGTAPRHDADPREET